VTALDAGPLTSATEPYWCPGCGDYVALDTVQASLPALGLERDKIVLFSGIGCLGQTPHYRNIDGIHAIHGRAPSIATLLAKGRPELSVWVIVRDGHTMMAGGNHLITAMGSNVNIKILLYDSQPDPLSLQCEISFLGRVQDTEDLLAGSSIDSARTGLTEVLSAAAYHQGAALIQVRPKGQRISPAGILRQVHH
jgi:2-oxoglutarate ferredoxin oxidoreductase subunit beta